MNVQLKIHINSKNESRWNLKQLQVTNIVSFNVLITWNLDRVF